MEGIRIEGLDRARALAAVSVMLAHLCGPTLPGPLTYIFTGHPAVIAFFVISGLCIHTPYVTRSLPVKGFLVARMLRLLPPVAVAYVAAQAVGLRAYNFVDGYILWSVVCELWYYSVYPALRALARIVPWHAQWALSMVVSYGIVLSLGTDQYGNAHVYGPWLNWLVGLPSWLLGCVLAEHLARRPRPRAPWVWRSAVALTAAILYWATMNTALGYYLTMNIFAILVAAWLLAEVELGGRTWLDRVGRWSFSIYLWHTVLAAALPLPLILQIPLVFAGCIASYWLIERPSHRIARQAFQALDLRAHAT